MLNSVKLQANTPADGDESKRAVIASRRLNNIILESLNFEDVIQKIADTIPRELYFGTGVVAVIDYKKHTIRRVAASRTKEAQEAIKALKVPFKKIEISLDDPSNLMAKAIRENKIFETQDTYDVLGPVISREDSKTIQAIMGTKTTLIYPIYGYSNSPIGVFIASTKKEHGELSNYEQEMIQTFVEGVGVAMEHARLFQQLQQTTEALSNANQRLKELDKLKDDFVSVASHELRTPMTAIKSYLWMALNKKKGELSPDLSRYLNRAYISVERLINLVNDMLNISRIEGGRIALNLSEVDLVELAKEVAEEVLPKAQEKDLEVVVLPTLMPKVLADKDKIHEVYLNLIGNSLKFTPKGRKITVGFENKYPLIISKVSDTGVGISEENFKRLFTKFGRLENSYVAVAESGGTGLGLYITKRLINLHMGEITVHSEGLGKGAEFSFSLPIIGTDAAQKLQQEAPKETENTKDIEKTKLVF